MKAKSQTPAGKSANPSTGTKTDTKRLNHKDERFAVLSDGTAETAEKFVRAILAQFEKSEAHLIQIPKLRSEDEIKKALDQIEQPCLICYTFATEKLRKFIWGELRRRQLVGFDVLYPAVQIFSEFLKANPSEVHGALHSTQSDNYLERIEAVEFTVKHDDGMNLSDLHNAEVILTGVSRTSKTPTSMFLGHKGYRTANVPLIPGIEPPKQLLEAHEHGVPIILLTINQSSLLEIRRSRYARMGSAPGGENSYLDRKKISDELDAAQKLAKRHNWPIINVTNNAIEETASEILLIIRSSD